MRGDATTQRLQVLLQPRGEGVHALQHAVRAQRRDVASGAAQAPEDTGVEAVKQDQGRAPFRHVLGRAQESVKQDLALDPEDVTYRNAPWWEQRLGGLLAGTAEGLDASSVEGGTACAFRAERVAGNTGRGGEEAPRGHGKHGQGERQAGRGPGGHAAESEGSGGVVPVRGDPGEATGSERGEPVKDYPAVPITPFTNLINNKDEVSYPTPAWPGF